MCFSDVFSGKWKLLILYELMNRELRFKEIKSALSGISVKVLTQTIQEMVNEGIILRIAYPEVPPPRKLFPVQARQKYDTTCKGNAFLGESTSKIPQSMAGISKHRSRMIYIGSYAAYSQKE